MIFWKTQLSDYPGNLEMKCGQHHDTPAISDFLDRGYRYKWVVSPNFTLWCKSHSLDENFPHYQESN